jgi:predicted nucleotidyltransferase
MLDRNKIVQYLQSCLPGIQGIYLFGSYAQGTATASSDVDVAILSADIPENIDLFEAQEALAKTLGVEHVDLVDLRKVSIIFQEEIVKTGQRLYAYDEAFCNDYENYILRKAIDFNFSRRELIKDIQARGSIYG